MRLAGGHSDFKQALQGRTVSLVKGWEHSPVHPSSLLCYKRNVAPKCIMGSIRISKEHQFIPLHLAARSQSLITRRFTLSQGRAGGSETSTLAYPNDHHELRPHSIHLSIRRPDILGLLGACQPRCPRRVGSDPSAGAHPRRPSAGIRPNGGSGTCRCAAHRYVRHD